MLHKEAKLVVKQEVAVKMHISGLITKNILPNITPLLIMINKNLNKFICIFMN